MSLIIYNKNRPSRVCTSRSDRENVFTSGIQRPWARWRWKRNETEGRGEGHRVVMGLGGAGWWTPMLACPDTVPIPRGSGVDPPVCPEEVAAFPPVCLKIADPCPSAFLGHLYSSWCWLPGPIPRPTAAGGRGQAGSGGVSPQSPRGGYSSLKRTAGSSLWDRAVRTLSNFSYRSAWLLSAPRLPQSSRSWNSVLKTSSSSALPWKPAERESQFPRMGWGPCARGMLRLVLGWSCTQGMWQRERGSAVPIAYPAASPQHWCGRARRGGPPSAPPPGGP